LLLPTGIAVAPDGDLIIADQGNHRIVFTEPTSKSNWSAYGTPGTSGIGVFRAPSDVHADRLGRIVVADPGNDRLVRIDSPDGSGWTEFTLPPGPKTPRPYAVAGGPDDGVLVTDLLNARVLWLGPDDTLRILIDGRTDGSLIAPVAVAMLSNTDIVVADAVARRISRWVRTAEAGTWSVTQQLDGRDGPTNKPYFSSLAGIAGRESP
jgi:hypothetical protein